MLYFLDNEFWSHAELVTLFIASLAVVIFVRYIAISVVYQYVIQHIYKKSEQAVEMVKPLPRIKQIKREIKWALLSSIIFALLCSVSLLAYQNNLTMIYLNVDDYSLTFLFLSPLVILILYETYYYWLHRWMHLPWVFKRVHKVHHESLSPTVFTSFAFHPLEALLQFIFFPVIILIIPIQLYMLTLLFTVLSLFAVVNHSGIEIYARGLRNVLIGSAHHELHHQQFRKNFGLNFTWWDKIMKTEGAVEGEKK